MLALGRALPGSPINKTAWDLMQAFLREGLTKEINQLGLPSLDILHYSLDLMLIESSVESVHNAATLIFQARKHEIENSKKEKDENNREIKIMREPLSNKPLVEAIFEARWDIPERAPGIKIDDNYKILIGILYQSVKDRYPFLEVLPSADIPDIMAHNLVQYRYRVSKDKWPLVQVGPGLLTLNDTDGYKWEEFKQHISHLMEKFFSVYPDINKLNINDVLIRYLDSIDFDYEKDDVLQFIKDKMKIDINISNNLFKNTGVNKQPVFLDLNSSFKSSTPSGVISIRFARGTRNNRDILLWETVVRSVKDDAPKNKNDIIHWLDQAHWLADDWFFKVIEGDLETRFK